MREAMKAGALFDGSLAQEVRRAVVANYLGLSPDHPESWPVGSIDGLLRFAEGESQSLGYGNGKAQAILMDQVARMLGRSGREWR
jgi:hypothetical protein